MAEDIVWEILGDGDVDPSLDEALRRFLVTNFPHWADVFHRRREWHRTTPLYTVLARCAASGEIVGHVAVVVRAATTTWNWRHRVASIQGVSVASAWRRRGVAREMISRTIDEAKRREFPFAILYCQEPLVPYYRDLGWRLADDSMIMWNSADLPIAMHSNCPMYFELGSDVFPEGQLDIHSETVHSEKSTALSAVAFDMDGLMFNTEDVYWKTSEELLRRRGKIYTEELFVKLLGLRPEPTFRTIIKWHQLSDSWEDLHTESEELFLTLLKDGFSLMPGLTELLSFLDKRGIPKAICTSSARRVVEAVLAQAAIKSQLNSQFEFVLTAEDIINGKPDPEIYLKAAQRFGVSPQKMLVLEDSVAGMESGLAAGAEVGVLIAPHNRSQDYSRATFTVSRLDAPEVLSRFTV